MAITKEKKEEIVKQLTNLFGNSKSVVFSDYKGLSVKEFGELRNKLREQEVNYKVAKKTLIKLAAEKAGFKEIPDAAFEGQVGLAFAQGDEISAAKTLYEFSKSSEHIKLLGAIMEGRTLTQEETLELAKIPGKDELLAKLVGTAKSPISGFHGVLASLIRNLAGVLSAYKEKIEKETPSEPEKAEEKPAIEKKTEPEEEAKPEEPKKELKEEPEPEEEKPTEPSGEKTEPEEEAKPAEEKPAAEKKPEK